jgi:hypothetical protein
LVGYSSATLTGEVAFPDQAVYSTLGFRNQSVILLVSTNDTANEVLLNEVQSLPRLQSAGSIYNGSEGWYFDANTGSLFVGYRSSGDDTVRFVFYSAPISPAIVLPWRVLLVALVVCLILEATALVILAARAKPPPEGSSRL